MELKNVKFYTPSEPKFGADTLYYIDENGLDFYDSVDKFTKKYKCCIEPETRVVRSVSENVAFLYPVGFDVVEVDELPDGINITGEWIFKNGKIVGREASSEELTARAEHKKSELLSEASAMIATLNDAVELEMASAGELQQLKGWKTYRVMLNRVDVSKAPDITWPDKP